MSHWSGRSGRVAPRRRGQTEPLAALAAVLVLGLAFGLYADALAAVEPDRSTSATAGAALQRVHDAVTDDGVAVPGRLPDALDAAPSGYDLNVTLSADDRRWTAGPDPPSSGEAAGRLTPVRRSRWTATPGHLRVVVWT